MLIMGTQLSHRAYSCFIVKRLSRLASEKFLVHARSAFFLPSMAFHYPRHLGLVGNEPRTRSRPSFICVPVLLLTIVLD